MSNAIFVKYSTHTSLGGFFDNCHFVSYRSKYFEIANLCPNVSVFFILSQNSLVIDTPRIRKQTRPFSATKDELAELSDIESDGDDKPKLRRPCDRSNGYGRTECFRVEKNLLVYG